MTQYRERESLGSMVVRLHREGAIDTFDLEALGRAFSLVAQRRQAKHIPRSPTLEQASCDIAVEIEINLTRL